MPRAFDRGVPPQDHNPLFGLLDFNNIDDVVKLVGGSVHDFVLSIRDGIIAFIYAVAGINLASWDDFLASLVDGKGIDLPWVVEGLQWLGDLFGGIGSGLPTPEEALTHFASLLNPMGLIEDLFARNRIRDVIIGIGNVLDDIPMIGDDLEAALLRLTGVKNKAVAADTRSTQIVEDVTAAWSNDTPTGTPTPVFDTIVAIRESFINGYTVLTFTTNDTWTVPAGLTELWYIVIGGGGRGQNGGLTTTEGTLASGGAGGSSGGYKAQQIDPSTLTVGATVSVTVGAAATTPGTDGGVTSIGSVVSVKDKGLMPTPFGHAVSESKPGKGGKGGDARTGGSGNLTEDGLPGEAAGDENATSGAGGNGGTGTGGNASPGGNASLTALTKSGGGGGGGGGGRRNTSLFQTVTAGDGGNGGYPGGGSGGGGAVSNPGGGTTNRGVAGTPGHGIAFIMCKAAA